MAALAAASGVASTSSSKALLATLPAPSPAPSAFTTLLHRSKFASYDPYIKQVYSAPPASAHRGDYGLKRPIPLRRKNAFITVKAVDSRAQQTEWNHGESQARFIKRWEELGVLAKARAGGDKGWERTLGQEGTEWRIDSEFYDAENEFISTRPQRSSTARTSLLGSVTQASLLDDKGYTKKIEAKSIQTHATHLVPNLDSMTPAEFKRFLNKCRELRPKFKEFLQSLPETKGKSLYDISQNTVAEYHRKFMQQYMHELFGYETADNAEQASKPKPRIPSSRLIEQKPHPTGALLYSHPSALTTFFTSPSQPGLVLQDLYIDKRKAQGNDTLALPNAIPGATYGRGAVNAADPAYFVSFAGTTAILRQRKAIGKKPLLDVSSEEGVNASAPAKTPFSDDISVEYDEDGMEVQTTYATSHIGDNSQHEARMRVINTPTLNIAPKVVGYSPEGLKGANLTVEVIADGDVSESNATQRGRTMDFGRENPYEPGSKEYILAEGGYVSGMRTLGSVPLSLGYQSRNRGRADTGTSEKLRRSNTMANQWSRPAGDSKYRVGVIDTLRDITANSSDDGYRIPGVEDDDWTDE